MSALIEPSAVSLVEVYRIRGGERTKQGDTLAVEEPLEIRLGCDGDGKRHHRPVSVTMRTPGHDAELAVGFLFTEGILESPQQVRSVRSCKANGHVICVDLEPGVAVDFARLERHFYTSSSCGVCGKTALECVLLVSGRASFELVQKAAVAGIPILAAVGAPSSLAVELAREHGLTVLGFVRQERFNIYTGAERIRQAADGTPGREQRVSLATVS
jgi:formate dehydrogenase assembly factor FdhD